MSEKFFQIKETLENLQTLLSDIELDVNEQQQTAAENPFVPNDLHYRVVHFIQNPFAQEIHKEELEFEQLKEENERLRAQLSLVETGNNANVTMRIDEAVNIAHQIKILQQTINEYKTREEKILSSLKKTAGEFREACFSLVGYRVDALKDNIYRLSHRYAERDGDKLFFEVKRDGTIVLLKNEYTRRYSEFVSTYIDHGDSFPAFLAAITLDIFKSNVMESTRSNDMSMSLSTTVMPNPRFQSSRLY